MRRNGQNTTSGIKFDHAIRSGMVENQYSHEIVAKNRNFSGILSHILLRMRGNGQNTTSGIKSDHAIRSGMPENLYVCEIVAENAILRALWGLFALRMRRRGRILLPVSDLTTPFDPAWSKTYIATKLWLKRNFRGTLSHIFTAHAQKRSEYYFRYQIWPRHSIRHARKPICLWNCGWKCYFKGTLRHVCTAHAQKGPEYYFRFQIWPRHSIRHGRKPI